MLGACKSDYGGERHPHRTPRLKKGESYTSIEKFEIVMRKTHGHVQFR
jgi:hypothetical protein